MNDKALVTGASGFIGRALTRRLIETGREVRCLARRSSEIRGASELGAEIVYGDLSEPVSLEEAVRGVNEIYHLAGALRSPFPRQLYKVNSEGTANLAAAVNKANPGLERFVYVSSQAAAGPRGKGPVSHYGRSKAGGEASLSFLDSYTIVRPAAVYGPGDTDFLPLFRMASKGIFLKPLKAGLLSFIYIDDCVSDIISARKDENYFISDGRTYNWSQVASALAAALGRRIVKIAVPRSVLRAYGAAGTAFGMIAGMPVTLNYDKVKEMLGGDWVMPEAPERGGTGIQSGFARTYCWYLDNGLI